MGKKIRVWDGTAWQDVSPSLPYTAIHSAQASMPLTGVDGQVWLDTDGTLAGQDFVPLSGGTMTGNLNVSSINAGASINKNYIINGGMEIWQRGTSFTIGAGPGYTADRWQYCRDGFATNGFVSRQNSGLAGFQYSSRVQRIAGDTSTSGVRYAQTFDTETSTPLAGKNVTISFYMKRGANMSGTNIGAYLYAAPTTSGNASTNELGSGYSVPVSREIGISTISTTNWTRYSASGVIPANTTQLGLRFYYGPSGTAGADDWFEITGVQIEEGSTVTPFTRSGVTYQAELAACQRYYIRYSAGNGLPFATYGAFLSGTVFETVYSLPVEMRIAPYALDFSNLFTYDITSTLSHNSGSFAIFAGNPKIGQVRYTHGSSIFTAGRSGYFFPSPSGHIGFSAEL